MCQKLAAAVLLFTLIFGSVPSQSQVPGSLPGDANRDGFVGPEDLFEVQSHWHQGESRLASVEIPGLPTGARPLRLIHIDPSSFQMGAPEGERGSSEVERPVRNIRFKHPFSMSETEITQGQWKALMGSLPEELSKGLLGVGDDFPIYFVSWEDTQAFLGALNFLDSGPGEYRLPSEAEWEYCCRAGWPSRLWFGDSLGCGDGWEDCAAGRLAGDRTDYMWYGGNNLGVLGSPTYGSKPVASLPANPFGFYGMHGNIREWCQDFFYGSYAGAPNDGDPWEAVDSGYRAVRDGAWFTAASDCRSAARIQVPPQTRANDIGFRVVYAPPLPPTPTATVTPEAPAATVTPTSTDLPSEATPTPTPSNTSVPATSTPTSTPESPVATATTTPTSTPPGATPTATQVSGNPFANSSWNVGLAGISLPPPFSGPVGGIFISDADGNVNGIAPLGFAPDLAGTKWHGTITPAGAVTGNVFNTSDTNMIGTFSGTVSILGGNLSQWNGTWNVPGVGTGSGMMQGPGTLGSQKGLESED